MRTIDADCHVIETQQTWAFMEEGEAKYRPHYLTSTEGKQFVGIDGKLRAPTFGGAAPVEADDPRETLSGRIQTTIGSRTMKDIQGRLRHMDELGVEVQVLYPSIFLGQLTAKPPYEAALCRSYNRWLAEIWKEAPDRLRWTVVPPLLDMDQAIEQIQFGKENGACGIFMRGYEGDRLLIDEYFFPFYEEAQRLDLALCVHAGGANPAFASLVAGEAWHQNKVPVIGAFHSLLFHGIPAMFPKLRFGFIEVAANWLPYILTDLDRRLERQGKSLGPNPLAENRMYVACQTNDDIPYIIKHAGEDNLVIGSDYGHSDTSSELEALRNLRGNGGLPEGTVRKILEDNPRALYGL